MLLKDDEEYNFREYAGQMPHCHRLEIELTQNHAELKTNPELEMFECPEKRRKKMAPKVEEDHNSLPVEKYDNGPNDEDHEKVKKDSDGPTVEDHKKVEKDSDGPKVGDHEKVEKHDYDSKVEDSNDPKIEKDDNDPKRYFVSRIDEKLNRIIFYKGPWIKVMMHYSVRAYQVVLNMDLVDFS
ncbi:hypothetical protein V9T40_012063 [Parthenolecanium corni]|uniref:Uncharacterized protein n=1 Tax=Parthenolecanium corni TaxID=536013 RepID=A0AAN9XYZ7_9HEMI